MPYPVRMLTIVKGVILSSDKKAVQCKITVIDKKGKSSDSEEAIRYRRLFGDIDYQPIGFEAFAATIVAMLGS